MKSYYLLTLSLFLISLSNAQTVEYDKVGIGTSPSYPLHIYETYGQGTSIMIDAESDANPNLYFYNVGSPVANFRYYDSGNDHFQLLVGNSYVPALNVSMDGKIGIGDLNPQYKLHVDGDSYFENDVLGKSFILDLDAGSSSYPKKITSEAVGGSATMEFQTYSYDNSRLQTRLLLRGSSGNDIEFYDKDETEYVHFDGDNKNVGIGTITPDPLYKLSVKGTIRAEEIKVETGWADFVFEKDYNLRPLQEVNAYIQQNGHLPEIPTAKEVEESGISLGEMNAKLLQKIEELTLYTIEQEKRIEKLEEIIRKLH